MTLLEARDVVKRFGGLVAVDHMTLAVHPGRVTALIGPNGAGKTTLFDCLTGMLELDGGQVVLDGRDISRLDVHERARAGIGRTFQRLEAFVDMTVAENVQVAAEVAVPGSVLLDLVRVRHRTDGRVAERVDRMLELTGLADLRETPAGDLPTGTLRRVELARALATEPRVLLLDEPASGLDPGETEQLVRVLRAISGSGVGILLVEHDVDLVMDVSDHVHVMHFGRALADGPPEVVAADPRVRAAYLGAHGSAGADGPSAGDGPGADDAQELTR